MEGVLIKPTPNFDRTEVQLLHVKCALSSKLSWINCTKLKENARLCLVLDLIWSYLFIFYQAIYRERQHDKKRQVELGGRERRPLNVANYAKCMVQEVRCITEESQQVFIWAQVKIYKAKRAILLQRNCNILQSGPCSYVVFSFAPQSHRRLPPSRCPFAPSASQWQWKIPCVRHQH